MARAASSILQAKTLGDQRCEVGAVGTVAGSETADRWPRAGLARYAAGAERRAVGAGHGSTLARAAEQVSSAKRESLIPDFDLVAIRVGYVRIGVTRTELSTP